MQNPKHHIKSSIVLAILQDFKFNNFAIGGFRINKFTRVENEFACECKQRNVKI